MYPNYELILYEVMNGIRADNKLHLDKKSKMVSAIEIFNKFCIEGGIFHGLSTRIKMEIKGFFKDEKEAEYFVLLES